MNNSHIENNTLVILMETLHAGYRIYSLVSKMIRLLLYHIMAVQFYCSVLQTFLRELGGAKLQAMLLEVLTLNWYVSLNVFNVFSYSEISHHSNKASITYCNWWDCCKKNFLCN
jgi:hypothetical protein